MKYTLRKLINNDPEILEYYQNANKLWEKIWSDEKSENEKELGKLISSYQFYFEDQCGGYLIGKEIMAWSAYSYLLATHEEFPEKKIEKLDNAFKNSFLSAEIYQDVDDARKVLNLE